MRQCKHPSCGPTCSKPNKEKKVYKLRRTPIKKKSYKIKKVSKKRKVQNKYYSQEKQKFLEGNPVCQIQSPVCVHVAAVIHHTNGREGERLNIVEDWMASCSPCNLYVECKEGTKWAYENGKKQHKHKLKNGLPNSLRRTL